MMNSKISTVGCSTNS